MGAFSEQDLADVLGIHEATRQRGGVAALQHAVLAAAERHIHATSSCFFIRSEQNWVHDFDRVAHRGLPNGWVELYLEQFATEDPLAPYVRDNPAWRFGVLTSDQLLPAGRIAGSRMFRDLFSPAGVHHMMGMELVVDGVQIGLVGLFRSERAGAFSACDTKKAALTSAAIALALRRALDQEDSRAVQERIGSAFAQMTGSSLVVLDDRLRVIYATAGAVELFGSRLQPREGRPERAELPAGVLGVASSLRRRLASSSQSERAALEASERIRVDDLRRELLVTIRVVEPVSSAPRYVLCVREARPKRCAIGPLLELGLTMREAEIVMLVGDGLRNADIAAQLRISVNTVQSHLRSVFGKLGVTNRVGVASRAIDAQAARPSANYRP